MDPAGARLRKDSLSSETPKRLSMLTKERYDRQSLAKFGRSRMRLAVIDFGDVVIFADELGNVGKMTKDKVEVPGRWEEAAYDVYTWLYTSREEARTSPT